MRDKTAAQDFINRTLVPKVDHRMTLADMRRHDWLNREGLEARQLYDEMLAKMRRVEDAKDAEKAAARRANHGGGGAVNAFERDTHRSIGGAVPPLFDPAVHGSNAANQLFAAAEDEDVLVRLTKQIVRYDSSARVEASPDTFSVRASLRAPGDSFELDGEVIETPGSAFSVDINVFRADNASDLLMANVLRTGGEVIAFQRFVKAVKAGMAPCGPAVGLAEEEEFSEDIGMI